MNRKVTPRSSLESLKREAKRWLKALKSNVAEARERLARALPNPPAHPTLRDVQHALAREHGLAGWMDLRDSVGATRERETPYDVWVERFLGVACPDHHVRGPTDHLRARSAAMRILKRFPQIATHDFYTAVVCGKIDVVRAALATDPSLARTRRAEANARNDVGGEGDEFSREMGLKNWTALLFLAFTRLPLESANDNAVEIARLLLDAGADPNAYFMAGDSRYTPLVGVIGEGEEDRPAHPHRDELVRLLMERGANPYDQQVLYNIHFHRKTLWFLNLAYEFSVKAGRKSDWDDPNWPMLDMGGYGSGAYFQLLMAVRENDLELARWILDHGASPNAAGPTARSMRSDLILADAAMRLGHPAMTNLLVDRGARVSEDIPAPDVEALRMAVLEDQWEFAEAVVRSAPDVLLRTEPIFAAIKAHRPHAVRRLLKLGVSPDVEDDGKQRPLHIAAYDNEVEIIRILIDAGAEIDPRESSWGNTPLGAATWSQAKESIDILAPLSRDVWELVMNGKVDRLKELFAERPDLGRTLWKDETPLMWLPDDDAAALEIVNLFLVNGADPSLQNEHGQTAADKAERRAMFEVSAVLREAELGRSFDDDEAE